MAAGCANINAIHKKGKSKVQIGVKGEYCLKKRRLVIIGDFTTKNTKVYHKVHKGFYWDELTTKDTKAFLKEHKGFK